MRPLDLLRLILDNLGRRKTRVALTAIGVVIGTAAVVVLVSLGIGLQRNATEQLGGISDLTLIQVYPQYGEFMGGGGGGPGFAVASSGPSVTALITPQTLEDLIALEGVRAVYPRDYLNVEAYFTTGLFSIPDAVHDTPMEQLAAPLPCAKFSRSTPASARRRCSAGCASLRAATCSSASPARR